MLNTSRFLLMDASIIELAKNWLMVCKVIFHE
mgnify:CR=1 FL=1